MLLNVLDIQLKSIHKGLDPISIKGSLHLQLRHSFELPNVIHIELHHDEVEGFIFSREFWIRNGPKSVGS